MRLFKFSLLTIALAAFAMTTPAFADGVSDIGGGGFNPGGGVGQPQREYVNERRQSTVTETRTYTTANGQQHTTQVQVVVTLTHGLRINGYVLPGAGLVVQRLEPGSPTGQMWRNGSPNRYRMERGDVLTAINGRQINSASDYFAALNTASQNPNNAVSLALRDINTGQINYFFSRLAWIPAGP